MNPATIDATSRPSATPLDLEAIRRDFPAIDQEVRPGVPLVYLDNAATALKPWPVLQAIRAYDAEFPANVHRGLHTLSEKATDAFEAAREKVAGFLNVGVDEVVFTRGTTEAINLVAATWGRANLKAGDEVVLSVLEHHANLVPWQMLAQETGAVLKFADITDDGRLELDAFDRLITERTKLVGVSAMSNVLGTLPPVAEIARLAHDRGALVLIDAAQKVAHEAVDARALGADFLAFSGHKMYGPTGIGVLYGRRELLEAMPPYQGGGSMVVRVTLDGPQWNDVPWKFEAGTMPIAQAIGLGAAIDYLNGLDREAVHAHERDLLAYAHRRLEATDGVRIIGPRPEFKGGILPLQVEGVHPHDLAQLLDRHGVAIRAGHHCAQPLHQRLKLVATGRASLALYNTRDEIDTLAGAIADARQTMTRRRP